MIFAGYCCVRCFVGFRRKMIVMMAEVLHNFIIGGAVWRHPVISRGTIRRQAWRRDAGRRKPKIFS